MLTQIKVSEPTNLSLFNADLKSLAVVEVEVTIYVGESPVTRHPNLRTTKFLALQKVDNPELLENLYGPSTEDQKTPRIPCYFIQGYEDEYLAILHRESRNAAYSSNWEDGITYASPEEAAQDLADAVAFKPEAKPTVVKGATTRKFHSGKGTYHG